MTFAWAALESDLREAPIFPVEAPDGKRNWPELDRQITLFRAMRMAAPEVYGFAIPNAGKRNPTRARQEGIMAGVFDTCWQWNHGCAWIELKGYDSRGRAGTLSQAQIDFGNRMHRMGHRVACFFDPMRAIDFLVQAGAPVRLREGL